MMEKRNFVTSIRTPEEGKKEDPLKKSAEAFDEIYSSVVSSFTENAVKNDENSDRENPGER